MMGTIRRHPAFRRPHRQGVRYAVVGLGHFAQAAVLPAFAHAADNSELAALVTGDAEKRQQLSKKYQVPAYGYDQYEECLEEAGIDAVYLVLPNHLHAEYTIRAARAGVHVLCEKPMALTEQDCEAMIGAAEDNGVKLMVGYRLHFEEANLSAVELVRSGKLGEPKCFTSMFSLQAREPNIRLRRETGGGPLYDIGIYCINAARYLFREEPTEVAAFTANTGDARFREVEEALSAILRFPGDRMATFTCSFGAADVSAYRIVGTEGDLQVEQAYEYAFDIKHRLTVDGKTRERTFRKRDQIAPELLYFSDCVLTDRDPEPSGIEGLADVRVIRALFRSAQAGKAVKLPPFEKRRRPTLQQEIRRPPVGKPELVRARSASG